MLRLILALALVARCSAMDFVSASSEYIDMGVVSAHALTSTHSYSVGFNVSGSNSNLFARGTGGPDRTWAVQNNEDASPDIRAVASGVSGNTGAYQLINGSDRGDGVPHVVTVAFDSASRADLWVDGSLEVSDTGVEAADSGSYPTEIGSSAGTSGALDGSIYFVILHDVQLSIDEHVEEHTTGLPARIPVSWYRPDLNGPTGTTCSGTVYDEADTAADGTCTNTPTFGEIPEGRTLR